MARREQKRPGPPEICPVCGEEVAPRAVACPYCGADHNSGWREDANLDLPGNDFDYEAFVRDEFGPVPRSSGVATVWWVTGIILFLALLGTCLYATW